MGSYSELKEIHNDIKHDKYTMIIIRIVATGISFFVFLVIFKALTEPVKIFGIELNYDKIKHDTITKTIHDTLYVAQNLKEQSKKASQKDEKGEINITSKDQSGGQTANQITNNY